jgi:putative transposase
LGDLSALCVGHDVRDAIMDFIAHWSERTEIRALQLGWMGLSLSKFHSWRNRYGKANEHNALVPRDHWLEPWEKVAILSSRWRVTAG